MHQFPIAMRAWHRLRCRMLRGYSFQQFAQSRTMPRISFIGPSYLACYSFCFHFPQSRKTGKLVHMVRFGISVLMVFAAASLFSATEPSASWSGKTAASYLDGRMAWWMAWPTAARDHETFCVSFHTPAPYAMPRPALRPPLPQPAPPPI